MVAKSRQAQASRLFVYRRHVNYSLANLIPDLEDLTAKRGLANVVRMRKPEEVTAWVLHQNGFDWQEMNALRDKIRAHFQIWESGKITQNAAILARLRSSSNGANKFCIAIEFDGNFEGNPGKGNFWKPSKYGRAHLTMQQIAAARRLIRAVDCMLPNLKSMYAHRQFGVSGKGKPNKPLCPGHEIWTHIGEWAKTTLGYSDGGPSWKSRGSAIPPDWRGVPMQDSELAVS